jgi:Activator of Hsp90 ATPase homolog 1-like protein
VEVTPAPDGDGSRVRLVHRNLPESERDSHDGGWPEMLMRLAAAATDADTAT